MHVSLLRLFFPPLNFIHPVHFLTSAPVTSHFHSFHTLQKERLFTVILPFSYVSALDYLASWNPFWEHVNYSTKSNYVINDLKCLPLFHLYEVQMNNHFCLSGNVWKSSQMDIHYTPTKRHCASLIKTALY